MVGVSDDPSSDPVTLPPLSRRVKRLERPNKGSLDAQIAGVQEEIEGLQGRVFEIKVIIDNKQQNKHVASQELLHARNRLSDLNSAFRSVVDERKALREELDLGDKMRERMRSDARLLRERLPYVRVEQIDEEINKLEYRLSHTSLSLQDEKRLLSQVEGFKKSRDFVRDYNERMDKITHDEGSRAELLDKMKEKDLLLNNIKTQQDEQRRILAEIREKEASQALDIPALIQERNTLTEKITALRDEVRNLNADYRIKEDEFWAREREWKVQQALERKMRAEKREAEWKEREKLRKQRAMENYVEPYTDEIILCEQLISYLLKFAPTAEGWHVTSQKVEVIAPEGFGGMITSKKNRSDDDLEGWFGGLGGKSNKKKNKASAPPKYREKDRLSLSLDALASFEKVNLSPPTTVGDVSKSISKLKDKKENFLHLQREGREAKDDLETETDGASESNGVASSEAEGDPDQREVSESVEFEMPKEILQEEEIVSHADNGVGDPEATESEDLEQNQH